MTITLNDPPIQQFTPKLGLQLPVAGNPLGYDLGSLRAALSALDAAVDARATPADVTAAIALLVNSAPTTLDTLKELALAINNDPDFATHVATQLSTLAGQISALAARVATGSQLGLVKVGAGLIVDPDGTLSAVGGSGGSGLPVFDELEIVPTSNGQTTFTVSGGYNPGQIKLTMNGVELFGNGDDFTATNGTSFTLTDGSKVTTTGTKFKLTRWIYLPSSMALNKAGDTMTGALLLAADPVAALQAATKQYVDATSAAAAAPLPIVKVTANTTATYGKHYVFTVGGVTLTLPSPGTAGNANKIIEITNASNTTTPVVDFGTGLLRQQSPGAMTVVDKNFTCRLKDSGDNTLGWI